MSGQQYFSFIPDENKLTAYQIFTSVQPGKVLITYTTALQQCIRSDRLWSITRHTLPPATINERQFYL